MEIIIIALAIVSAILLAILVDQGNGKRSKPHLPKAPAPKHVLEETPKKDISEPVISFVKFLKENPESFYLKRHALVHRICGYEKHYTLFDIKNRKKYKYYICVNLDSVENLLFSTSVSFLTRKEREYLLEAHEWGMRYIEAKEEVKRKARDLAEREEYKKIYCKEK